ncbi:SRPBCC family protein [Paenibacillus kobensis]|uniref:SRPBCC family protein n=1 Tax=Paenibacillus kobensis TaxID=59841 RepID=UPI000FDA53C6|nr:SRPBCC family protein [Paenibacillus kobensis]
MITITTETEINAPIAFCFDLARDIEIHTQTVWKHTNETAIGGRTKGLISIDETVTFQATHFIIRQRLTSKITEYQRPFHFSDEMLKGAFKSMKHKHEFEERDGITVMKDTLIFEAPLGLLGRAVEKIILKKYMKSFLEYRNEKLKQIAEEGIMNFI